MDQVVKKKQEQLLQCLKKISSKQSADDDDQRQQLRKFQSEVEQKFKAAHHNHHYRFPLEYHDNSNDSSLDELRKPGPYDLKSQNKKPQSKSLVKIMSDKQVRQSTRYKTEQYDENRFPHKSVEKQTNEQIISFLRKSVAKRSQYSQHTQRSNNQSHIMSQSFNCKTRTQNYYLNKFTKMKLDMCKNQTSTSYQDSKISLKHFFSKSPEQTSTINLKNKLAEMCKRQPLKVL